MLWSRLLFGIKVYLLDKGSSCLAGYTIIYTTGQSLQGWYCKGSDKKCQL